MNHDFGPLTFEPSILTFDLWTCNFYLWKLASTLKIFPSVIWSHTFEPFEPAILTFDTSLCPWNVLLFNLTTLNTWICNFGPWQLACVLKTLSSWHLACYLWPLTFFLLNYKPSLLTLTLDLCPLSNNSCSWPLISYLYPLA